MSTSPSEQPRLPDEEKSAAGDQPDLDRDNSRNKPSRLPPEEKAERIPEPDE
jgi:hypothetical protein